MSKQKRKSKIPPGFAIVVVAIIASGLAAGIIAGVLSRGGNEDTEIKLPDFAYAATAPKGSAKAYQFAVDFPDILAQIPCYCGCGQLDGHKNNLDCFIKSRDGNKVVFDRHAAG